ncbi:MAG: FtsX-like permease family protein [Spirochaetota bacterium]
MPPILERHWLLWLVWKYLQSRSKVHAGSSLWLVVLGLAIGVATLIVVLTGMGGLQSLLTDSIDEVTAYHLQVAVKNEADSLLLRERLGAHPAIVNATRYREAPMLLNTGHSEPVVALVRAVEVADFMADPGRSAVMQTMGAVRSDNLEYSGRMWVGLGFSYEHSFAEGDRLQVLSAEHVSGRLETSEYDFMISAIYRLSNPNIEKKYVFIALGPETDNLFYNNEYYLGLKLERPGRASYWKRELEQELQGLKDKGELSSYRLRTGREVNGAFFNALRTEKSFLQLLVSLIFIVVAFQIFQSTRRTVYARIPELMLLRALGAGPLQVRSIFLLESFFVALLGTGLGIVCGMLLSWRMNEILLWISGLLFQIPALLPNIATDVAGQDLLIVAGSALVFSSAASWLATKKLLYVSPIEVLKNE